MRTPFAPALASFPLLASLALAAQTGGPCPDQRSSPIPAASDDLAPWRTCVLRVRVLGVAVSIPNGRCPSGHTYVPAHEECLGAIGPNSACEELGPVPIELELCSCVWHGGPWVSFSSCECRAAGTMGFVTEGRTVECH